MLRGMVLDGRNEYRWHVWTNSLVLSFAYSIAFHVIVFSVLEVGHARGWWEATVLPSWLAEPVAKVISSKPLDAKAREELIRQSEPPLLFVEVDPVQASTEAPKDAKYYSSLNSVAANPKPDIDTGTPKIEGTQTKVMKTTDEPRPEPAKTEPKYEPTPLQPVAMEPLPPQAPEPAKPTPQPKAEPKPEPQVAQKPAEPGDMEVGKPQPARPAAPPKPASNPNAAKPRPRTLAEAREQRGLIAGEKIKQDGGVKRHATMSSLDAKATPFGSYDAAIIAAIQQRWFNLLDQHDYTRGANGKVVVDFRLMEDGRVLNLHVSENTVGELLALICQRAILDPSPYAPWPGEMRRLLKANYRDVRFTFYYD